VRVEGGAQRLDVVGAEHDPVAGGDVDEVEIDLRPGDPARQVGEHASAILHVDDRVSVLFRARQWQE
jgi:hypothetical protein